MAKASANTVPMMLTAACVAMLVSTVLAFDIPLPVVTPNTRFPGLLPPVKGAGKCWSPLTNIPGCRSEIYNSVSSGHVSNIGPACCNAINQVTDKCWTKMLPYHPLLPSSVKNFCAPLSPYHQPFGRNPRRELFGQLPLVNVGEIRNCWSSIVSTQGCALEIGKLLSSAQITGIGPACCKTVTEIKDKCWPKLFPFNPFFPPLLKNTCAKVIEATSTPKTT